MQENDAVSRSLGVPSLVSCMQEAAARNKKDKGKDVAGCDEYIPKILVKTSLMIYWI